MGSASIFKAVTIFNITSLFERNYMANFELFKELIIQEKFFEAHEVLEEYWQKIRKSNNPYKNAYRGFINAAVAMELRKRGRNSYKKVWENYEKYRYLYLKKEKFIEIMHFLDNLNPCK
jgi:predicted metal-dependent hydrolase